MMVAEQGLFTKNYYKIRIEKEGLKFALVLDGSNLYGFLGRFARRWFGRCILGSRLDRGQSRFTKNSGGSGLVESGIPYGTSGWSP